MIEVTSLSGNVFYLNNELIYKIEALPDTTIMLTDGRSLVVKESMKDLVEKIIAYKRKIYIKD